MVKIWQTVISWNGHRYGCWFNTITPASGFVGVEGAIILGTLGGVICYIGVEFIRIKMKIDDSLDVFAVHGIGGMLGTILCGYLISESFNGVGYDEGLNALDHVKIQLYGVVVTLIWTLVFTFLILKVISFFTFLRVSEEEETNGLDTSSHGESGYKL